jgi:hypothetical protein
MASPPHRRTATSTLRTLFQLPDRSGVYCCRLRKTSRLFDLGETADVGSVDSWYVGNCDASGALASKNAGRGAIIAESTSIDVCRPLDLRRCRRRRRQNAAPARATRQAIAPHTAPAMRGVLSDFALLFEDCDPEAADTLQLAYEKTRRTRGADDGYLLCVGVGEVAADVAGNVSAYPASAAGDGPMPTARRSTDATAPNMVKFIGA